MAEELGAYNGDQIRAMNSMNSLPDETCELDNRIAEAIEDEQ